MRGAQDVLAGVVMASLAALVSSPASAQPYPGKPVKLVLPYTPGSPNDVLARLVAPYLSTRLAQPVIIDNRPGGGTTIGAKAVMTAEPDGYTLLYSNSPTHLIAALASRSPPYDPIKDFAPVAMVGASSNIIVIAAGVPAGSVREFVEHARAHPGKLNFGFGQGTQPHLIGEMFKLATGADLANIPYRGGAQAISDLLGGRIHMNIGTLSTLLPLIRDGRVRALAVTGTARSADLPDVPTMSEAGFPSVTSVSYYGILGPVGIAAEAVARLNVEVNEILKSAELKSSMVRLGFDPTPGSGQEFAALLAAELERWAPVVKATGFAID